MGALAVLQASVFSLEEADGPTSDSLVQIVHCSSILHHCFREQQCAARVSLCLSVYSDLIVAMFLELDRP